MGHTGATQALDKVKSTAAAQHVSMPASAGDEGRGEQEHANALQTCCNPVSESKAEVEESQRTRSAQHQHKKQE